MNNKTNEHFNIVKYIWWCILCWVDWQEQKVLLKLSSYGGLDKYVVHTLILKSSICEVKYNYICELRPLLWWLSVWAPGSQHTAHKLSDHYSTQLSPPLGCVLGLQLTFLCNYQTFDMTNYCPTKPSTTSAKELNLICRSNGLLLFILFFSFCF